MEFSALFCALFSFSLDAAKLLFSCLMWKAKIMIMVRMMLDAQLPGFISSYLKRRSVEIEPKASEMMAEFVGADLSRMAG